MRPNDQTTPEFLSLNPNNKIPAILDPNGPDGQPLALFESGAILVYLASKTGQLMPQDTAGRYETLQRVMGRWAAWAPCLASWVLPTSLRARDYEETPARPVCR